MGAGTPGNNLLQPSYFTNHSSEREYPIAPSLSFESFPLPDIHQLLPLYAMCGSSSLSTTVTVLMLSSSFLLPVLPATRALVLPVDPQLIQMDNVSFVSHGRCPFGARPAVPLPGDGQRKEYTTSSGLSCLDIGSPHEAECWDLLQLDVWLAQWFLKTPQCPPNATSVVSVFRHLGMPDKTTGGLSSQRESTC